MTRAIEKLQEAVAVRKEITELYAKYTEYSTTTRTMAFIHPRDLKRAVDALYYLGGGWPNENSKGRMEALLDSFVGMYRVLHFIGEGHLVVDHLRKYGVSVSLDPAFEIDDRELDANEIEYIDSTFGFSATTLRDLVKAVVQSCMSLQRSICSLADQIKDVLRPQVQEELDIENPEYDRLHTLVRLSMSRKKPSEKMIKKRQKISTTIAGLNNGIALIAKESK